MRFSNTLHVNQSSAGKQIVCTACDKGLAPVDASWKKAAALTEQPANNLPGPYHSGRGLLLRQFCCPHCGALLDTELATTGEPFLEDRLFIGP